MKKRPTIVSGCIVVLLVVLLTILWEFVPLIVGASYAVGNVEYFQAIVRSSASRSPNELIVALQDIANYYPSGSRFPKNSKADRIVEAARATATLGVIAELRCKTAKDYGDDPKRWIQELSGSPGATQDSGQK